ncbi:unnamed protein product, partial [Larinioides sclopetarius]
SNSVVGSLGSVVSNDGVVSCLLVVSVGLFVSGSLILSVSSNVPVLAVAGTCGNLKEENRSKDLKG